MAVGNLSGRTLCLFIVAGTLAACSLLNQDRGPKLDCATDPTARTCTNNVLGVCQNGQPTYEICSDEGKFCNVVNEQPVCGGCQPLCNGKQCGDDGCGGSCGTCPTGSGCSAEGECISGCMPNCAGKVCGDDGCGGSCGTCPTDAGGIADHFCVTAAEDHTAGQTFIGTCQPKCFNSDYTDCVDTHQFSLCMNPEATFADCATGTTCTGAGTQDGSSPCQ